MLKVDCKGMAAAVLDLVQKNKSGKTLVIITMGDDPASASYVKGKIKDCIACGVPYVHYRAETETELRAAIMAANVNKGVGGIIVQLPLPDGVDEKTYTNMIRPELDVDGFLPGSPYKPCTPEGIVYLLRKELGDLTGKTALIIGRGELVGKPLIQMLLDEDCTVTVAHSHTRNLDDLLGRHDIIVSAAGRAGLVDLKKCKAEIVVDVGVNRNAEGKLCGDCINFDPGDGSTMKVTPVPGGIGLMTRAMLLLHMFEV